DLALRAHADHLVITGDLTEDGSPAQFESLAQILAESGWAPSRVTLVPGNHDVYSHPDAWSRALAGPLRDYAPSSEEGAIVTLRAACLAPLPRAFHRPFLGGGGALWEGALGALGGGAPSKRHDFMPAIIALHPPPHAHVLPPLQWLDGLHGHEPLRRILE